MGNAIYFNFNFGSRQQQQQQQQQHDLRTISTNPAQATADEQTIVTTVINSNTNTITREYHNPLNDLNRASDIRFSFLSHFLNKKRKLTNSNELQTVQFASYFLMAGRRFKNMIGHSQNFLFGDNLDLNFILTHKPVIVSLIIHF